MKKFIRFIAIFAAFAIITAITASAATAQSATCSVANGIGQDGYTVSITLSTKRLCDGIQGEFYYDAEKLSLKNDYGTAVKKFGDGALRLALVADSTTGKTDWITFSFTSEKIADSKDFSFENAKAVLHDAVETVPVNTTPVIFGDANDDDAINVIDLVRVKKIVAGISGTEEGLGSDCDGSGECNSYDLTLLKKFLLGIKGTYFGKQA